MASRLSRATGSGPADFRTAISRAYYAAYNVAVDVLVQIGAPPGRGPGGHSTVANCLMASKDDAVKVAGISINQLHTRRIQADYRLERTDVETQSSAVSACETAHDIIRHLEALSADKDRCVSVRPNISAYLNQKRSTNTK